jgi:PAS domain S-box-containing protein
VSGHGEVAFDADGQVLSLIGTIQDITDRRSAEESLRSSEAKLNLALHSAAMGVWTWDIGENIRHFDGRVCELLGIDQSSFAGTQEEFFQMVLPEDHQGIRAAWSRTFDENQPYEVEYRVRWKDGSIHAICARGRLTRDETGRPLRVLGILWDITGRKQNEEAIKSTSQRLQLATTSASMGVWDWDLQVGTMTWDDRMFELYGASRGEIQGTVQDWKDGLHPGDLDRAIAECEAAIRGEAPFDTEFRVKHSDGTVLWIKANAVVMRDQLGNPLRMIGINQDVTERKLAEHALAASEAEARTMLQTAMDGVWLIDAKGRLMEVNDAACRMLGFSRDEMRNMGVADIDAFESPEDLGRHIARVAREGSDLFESIHRRKDGTCFPVEISITHIAEQSRTVAYVRDISERKAHETQRRRMNEELEERVKERTLQLEAANKEMESFSYSVSHDLRAPLRSIDGFSQVLLEDYQDQVDESGKHYLSRIRLGAQRMGHLIDDLLKLSKTSRSELTLSECDLSGLSSRVAGNLADLNPERKVEVSIKPGMVVQADQHLMQVVLENLLGNAWKFTAKRKDPSIEVGETASPRGDRTFFIRDNGAGFDMAFADKLFNPFQRLHAVTEFDGTGIGLAIVQRIIHRHGGRIWAEASPGEGATFFFALPD